MNIEHMSARRPVSWIPEARTEPSDAQISAAIHAATATYHAGKSYSEQMRAAIIAARRVETEERADFANLAA